MGADLEEPVSKNAMASTFGLATSRSNGPVRPLQANLFLTARPAESPGRSEKGAGSIG